MNRHFLLATIVTALFSTQAAWAQPATITVNVTLDGGVIRVPETVFVDAGKGPVRIEWRIEPPANIVFAPVGRDPSGKEIPGGINFDGERVRGVLRRQDQIHSCGGGPKRFACMNEASKRGEFKYTIRVLDESSRRPLSPKDPIIVNR